VFVAVFVVTVGLLQAGQPRPAEPWIAISVRYPASAPVEQMRRDFMALKTAGFNAVAPDTLVNLDRLTAVASETGLRVMKDPAPSGSSVTIGGSQSSPAQARVALWSAIASGSRTFELVDAGGSVSAAVLSLGETVGVVTRNQALFAPLQPRKTAPGEIAVDGSGVAVHILESADAMAIIALNHAREVRKVSITFKPEIPEAIWQNMEDGASVHFVMSSKGPVLEHTFAPQDVLVLAIRKKLR
jgi:hypothetical protein